VLLGCGPASIPEQRDEGRLGRVEFFRPAGPPSGFAILLSDAEGWSPAWERAGRALAAQGAAVVGVDVR
jgi:type IV secretory pathway VirJ component